MLLLLFLNDIITLKLPSYLNVATIIMNSEIRSALIRVLPFALIIFILLLQLKRGKISNNDLGINKPVPISHFLYWLIGFFCFAMLIEFWLYKIDILEIEPWHHPLFSSVIRITGAVILAPIAEEFIFRGLFLKTLMAKKIHLHAAVILQAAFFVLLHNFTYQNSLSSKIGIAQSFTDAMLFGYAKHYTRSILTPVAMHITGNTIATVERFIM